MNEKNAFTRQARFRALVYILAFLVWMINVYGIDAGRSSLIASLLVLQGLAQAILFFQMPSSICQLPGFLMLRFAIPVFYFGMLILKVSCDPEKPQMKISFTSGIVKASLVYVINKKNLSFKLKTSQPFQDCVVSISEWNPGELCPELTHEIEGDAGPFLIRKPMTSNRGNPCLLSDATLSGYGTFYCRYGSDTGSRMVSNSVLEF